MGRRRVLSRGMDLGRHGEIDYTELDKETSEKVSEGDRLQKLGEKFESDKNKLEEEIDKVMAAKISRKDKAALLQELKAAIEKLQEQYDEDVAAEQARVQEEIQARTERMEEAVDELEQQADSLRGVNMDAAATDASSAADAAEAKKQEFEKMKSMYDEKLRMQMEQAEIQRNNIQSRRSNV